MLLPAKEWLTFLKPEGVADINGEGCFAGAAIGGYDRWHGCLFLHLDVGQITLYLQRNDVFFFFCDFSGNGREFECPSPD